MTNSQRRRRAAVGSKGPDGWAQLNALAIGAVVVGAAALIVVVIGAIARDGGGGVPAGFGTPGGGNETVPAVTETSTLPTTAPTEETPPPTANEPEIVECGDILAPLAKAYRLPADCAPDDLQELPASMSHGGTQWMRAEAAVAFERLIAGASDDGFEMAAVSAYRSYDAQVAAYEDNRAIYGDEVDRYSARPGHSEHQLGTTVDVSSGSVGYGLESFEGSAEAEWVAANSWEYGFIVSYPEGKEDITGYAYEPWHLRYVGEEEAAKVRESGLTLHEYLLEIR